MVAFAMLTLLQVPLCIYYRKVVFLAQKCTHTCTHRNVCLPPHNALLFSKLNTSLAYMVLGLATN